MLMAFAVPMGVAADAQTAAPVYSTQPDAEALAVQMRVLAVNPEDLDALIVAGELATRLGDTAGATAFFIRADHISPQDSRLLAAKAVLAVRTERPGDALRLFDRAAAAGLPLTPFMADRGLAYDLTGDQPRAQRDYREALKLGGNDETTRRLALSLGISGKRDAALELLDPLLRRSDRGAWRARAFVLAMTGDVSGAGDIADSMLPPTMATGLQSFFRMLPQLGPVDRAFAVHFGELRATPERLADARLAPILPPLPPLPPEPVVTKPPVQVAVARPIVADRDKRKRRSPEPVVPRPAPQVVVAEKPPLPTPPRESVESEQPAPAPVQIARNDAAVPTPRIPAANIPAQNTAPAKPEQKPEAKPEPKPEPKPQPKPETPVESAPLPKPVIVPGGNVVTAAEADGKPETAPIHGTPERPTESIAASTPTVAVPPRPLIVSPAQPVRSDVSLLDRIVAGIGGESTATGNEASVPIDKPRHVVAPAVATPEAPATKPKPKPVSADCLPATSTRGRAATHPTRRGASPAKDVGCPAGTKDAAQADAGDGKGKSAAADDNCLPATGSKGRKPATSSAAAKRRGAGARKTATCPANDKGANDKGANDKDGAEPDSASAKGKAAADDCAPVPTARGRKSAKATASTKRGAKASNCPTEPDAKGRKKGEPTKKDPARVWVQVAGGAYEGDLIKAWAAVKAKAPVLFRSREAWTTPLRATNRVLTGPFKTREEAQSFVNTVAKSGLSAFVFESEAGQKVEKLGVK